MPISKITQIAYEGSFASQYGGEDGLMHTHIITLEDGTQGQAKTKNPTAPYGVGEEVEYAFDGEYQGVAKLKIKKAGGPAGGFRGGSSGGSSGGFRKSDPAGQMVGACLHDAVTLVSHGAVKGNQFGTVSQTIEKVADMLCDISMRLKAKHAPAATPAPAPAPQQQQQRPPIQTQQGQPVQTRPVEHNVPIDDDEDIPF